MAKFFITNNAEWYEAIKTNVVKTDFNISFDYSSKDVCAVAVHKLSVENQNAVRENDDFCIATGTCIYNESLDVKPILDEYNGDVGEMRERTIGQYGVCVAKDDNITLYTDPTGMYDMFYYVKHTDKSTEYLIGTALYEIAEVLHDKLTLEEIAILERTIHRVNFNGRTFFHEIKKLHGEEYLTINRLSGDVKLESINVDYSCASDQQYEETMQKVAEALKKNAEIINKVLGRPTILATGGIDSRLVLATYLSNGIKPRLLTAHGKSVITPGPYWNGQDNRCMQVHMDWSTSLQIGRILNQSIGTGT